MGKVSIVCFAISMTGIFVANGISNAMKRLVYNRSGKTFRVLSRQLVREYRTLYGKDQNYWAYWFSLLAAFLGIMGFAFLPK